MADKEKIASLTFEQALQELQRVIQYLEGGQAPLEEAVAAYERGVNLKKQCDTKLRQAYLRVEKIKIDAEGKPVLQPLEDEAH